MQTLVTRTLVVVPLALCSACPDGAASDSAASCFADTADGTTTGSDGSGVEPPDMQAEPSETTLGSEGESGGETETGDGDDGSMPDPDLPPNENIPPVDAEGCHAIYAQDLLPTFEIELTEGVWELLQQEWLDGPELDEQDLDAKHYHPVKEFKYGEVIITNAEIRLRGNPEYWDEDDKLQLQVGFHTNDPDGKFLGLKRLAFDAATYNRHMLRDRLAYAVMRDVGIRSPCANNARLVINGQYYGIFTNVEKLDEVFLERNFDDPTGDLWKRTNWTLKTNQDTTNDERLQALRDTDSVEELETYLDIAQSLRVFAAEAVIPDSDGMWAGGFNFYLYDEPIGGKFMMLPWDMDNTFERFDDDDSNDYPLNPDPVVWEKEKTHGRPWYELALSDPAWFALYIDYIDEIVHDGYSLDKMHERIDTWTAQIQDAVIEDTNKPWDNDEYFEKVDELRDYVDSRYEFLDEWLVCWQNGGVDDGDGYCEDP